MGFRRWTLLVAIQTARARLRTRVWHLSDASAHECNCAWCNVCTSVHRIESKLETQNRRILPFRALPFSNALSSYFFVHNDSFHLQPLVHTHVGFLLCTWTTTTIKSNKQNYSLRVAVYLTCRFSLFNNIHFRLATPHTLAVTYNIDKKLTNMTYLRTKQGAARWRGEQIKWKATFWRETSYPFEARWKCATICSTCSFSVVIYTK